MRNFSWLIPGQLAGLAMVGRWSALEHDVQDLYDHGVKLLVTLTQEVVAPEVVRAGRIEPLHLPVRDFGPPSPEQLETFVARARQVIDAGAAVAVHCFAGMGRTGTFLAAYLVSEGRSGQEAIDHVRRRRPGSIETAEQERAVLDYATRLASGRRPASET